MPDGSDAVHVMVAGMYAQGSLLLRTSPTLISSDLCNETCGPAPSAGAATAAELNAATTIARTGTTVAKR
jgi:hypothetical protein